MSPCTVIQKVPKNYSNFVDNVCTYLFVVENHRIQNKCWICVNKIIYEGIACAKSRQTTIDKELNTQRLIATTAKKLMILKDPYYSEREHPHMEYYQNIHDYNAKAFTY